MSTQEDRQTFPGPTHFAMYGTDLRPPVRCGLVSDEMRNITRSESKVTCEGCRPKATSAGLHRVDLPAAASAYLTCLVSDSPLQLGARAVWASLVGIPDDDTDALVAAAEEAVADRAVAYVSPF